LITVELDAGKVNPMPPQPQAHQL